MMCAKGSKGLQLKQDARKDLLLLSSDLGERWPIQGGDGRKN